MIKYNLNKQNEIYMILLNCDESMMRIHNIAL